MSAGHSGKYVHIIDELKQKAVDSLPDIIGGFYNLYTVKIG